MEKTLGQFIKEKRIEKNLTQKELGKILYVSESAVSKWEKDVAKPDITLLPKLSSVLGVTEHEIITASTDNESKIIRSQARKWKNLSKTWDFFFIIGYVITILTCFICNLAVDKTLDWFFIVLFSVILSATFTNLPKIIKVYRIILIPLTEFIALSVLLIYTESYTNGDWAFIAIFSTFVFLVIIFLPIILSKYVYNKIIKSFIAHVSIFVDFVLIILLLLSICKYTGGEWFNKFALPLTAIYFATLLLFVSVKFLSINKMFKASMILFLSDVVLCLSSIFIPDFVLREFPNAEINERYEFLRLNFVDWSTDQMITNNVYNIVLLVVLSLSVIFAVIGILKKIKQNNNA